MANLKSVNKKLEINFYRDFLWMEDKVYFCDMLSISSEFNVKVCILIFMEWLEYIFKLLFSFDCKWNFCAEKNFCKSINSCERNVMNLVFLHCCCLPQKNALIRKQYSMNKKLRSNLCTCIYFFWSWWIRRFHWTLIERFVYWSGSFARKVNTESLEGVWIINREQAKQKKLNFFSNRYQSKLSIHISDWMRMKKKN